MAKVLIIENDRIAARDLFEIVESLGHEGVGIAANFEDAKALASEHVPDIALIDIHIDGEKDGIALATELREDHSMALAFLTSHADKQTVAKASAIRPNGYLIKPFDPASVDALVSTALANYDTTQASIDCKRMLESEGPQKSALSETHANRVSDYIDHHLDEHVKIEELAALCGLGESSFTRQFHARFGTSPYNFLITQRIGEAKRLLRNTGWSIADIALAVGFSNQAHFTTTFKKFVEVTPSEYRRLTH
ncbi:response regulator transcription factor [Erythrobacter rubeus]|uniref:DNA-binding response regulator n=1 Tax=Erythrobacter rubeus TaxID=2760803 RepID=A0ABR8KVE0_9SPHN|nr:DNA-binding response regulator [Erythrobacter rubeus]MBD2843178.1 DNA-binding response regulator [Erythrobacter rubeus]